MFFAWIRPLGEALGLIIDEEFALCRAVGFGEPSLLDFAEVDVDASFFEVDTEDFICDLLGDDAFFFVVSERFCGCIPWGRVPECE